MEPYIYWARIECFAGCPEMSRPSRSALLIRCSASEAARVRSAAHTEDRTVSGYVLHVLRKAWPIEERIRENLEFVRSFNLRASDAPAPRPLKRPAGPRTALLIRCGAEEAVRIRRAARRKHMTLSAYVLDALARNWRIHDHLQKKLEEFRKEREATNLAIREAAGREWRASRKS